MPGVLLRALSEYKFAGTPLWRMSEGKDLVRVELTFHKKLPAPRVYKKGAESRRQPAPPPPPPLLASGLASPHLLKDRRHAENRRRWRGRRYHHHHRLQHRRRIRSSNYATRIQLPSPHHRLSSDQHQHQRLPSHRRRRSLEKSLQNQRKTAQYCAATTPTKNLSRSTRSMTSRIFSATSSMEETSPSSRPKDSREKKKR